MIEERTIRICGKKVRMRYCLAAEQGYEVMSSGNTVDVFNPTVVKKDKNGKSTKVEPPKANTSDYVKLAFAAIVAAYEREKQPVPITMEEILFDSSPEEAKAIVSAVIELRLLWYKIPDIVKPETNAKEGDREKNA